jgi:hypothetical protein
MQSSPGEHVVVQSSHIWPHAVAFVPSWHFPLQQPSWQGDDGLQSLVQAPALHA